MFSSLATTIIEAMGLPAEARVDRRIAKTVVVDQAPTPALKKLVRDTIVRLDWVAELSPASIGIPAREDPPAPAINVLVLTPTKVPTQKLLWAIHSMIPAPVMLIADNPGGNVAISFGPLRNAERTGGVVVEHLVDTPSLQQTGGVEVLDFVASLAIFQQPHVDLGALYEALIVRAEALQAARASDTAFRLPTTAEDAQARRERLTIWRYADAAWESARNNARKEKRLAQAVDLGERARVLKVQRDAAAAALA